MRSKLAVTIPSFLALAGSALTADPSWAGANTAIVVPTVYEAGHFYATPEAVNGKMLKLLVDTGGGGAFGMYWITSVAAKRLGLGTSSCKVGKDSITVAEVPDFKIGRGLPSPLESPCGTTLMVHSEAYQGGDGQLGAGYLPGRVWTFDYPGHRLVVQGPQFQPAASAHAAKLGFPLNAKGEPASGFARITIQVDGEPIQMLLDTGATAHPTVAGERASATPTVHGYGVTSYIDNRIFTRWHKTHPDWHIVKNGDDLFGTTRATDLIEVPNVEVAGWSMGPVWFTERPDHAFRNFMSSMMDETVDGALGGNVFQHFVMTIDYPQSTAYFNCSNGCNAAIAHSRDKKM